MITLVSFQSLKKIYKHFFVAIVVLFSTPAFSQVDFEFWFAAPYANINHNPNSEGKGGRPIYLRLATQDAEATVTVSMPANPSFPTQTIEIAAESTESIDLTPWIDMIQCSNDGDEVEQKALFIKSDALITAYYEIASVLNGDLFSLKGQNALGKEFYAPIQNKYPNSDFHKTPGQSDGYGLYLDADRAYSYIVIAATENNTQVIIDMPNGVAAVGIAKGGTKTVKLNKGETYVVRSVNELDTPRMGGAKITSTKDVAITIGDDSVWPQGLTKNNDCEDYIGDQIVPIEYAGTEYWIIRGFGEKEEIGYTERIFITATEDGTKIYQNDVANAPAGAPFATLNAGEQIEMDLGGSSAVDYMYVSTDKPVYVFQVSGYECEVAGALLPSVDKCTGSYKVGFVRTYGGNDYEKFYMNLMVKGADKDGEKDFIIKPAGSAQTKIDNAEWKTMPGSDWKVTRIVFNQYELPEGPYYLQNTTSLFHMALVNSRSFDWGGNDGLGLMGASYGYFSKFSDNKPTAIIVNNNDTVITVEIGTKVSLLAGGGFEFDWTGEMWNGNDWTPLEEPYFLNKTDVENPFVVINEVGIYKYTASINTECYGVVDREVLIKTIPPVGLNDVFDTVCPTEEVPEYISEFYNLGNLNDTIVGKKGSLTGYYVAKWYKWIEAQDVTIFDFDGSPTLYPTSGRNASFTQKANPQKVDPNTSDNVGYLKRNQKESLWSFDLVMELTTPINLAVQNQFEFDIRYDGASGYEWENDKNQAVYLEFKDAAGNVASVLGRQFSKSDRNLNPLPWYNLKFDFSGYEQITGAIEARIRVKGQENNGWIDFHPGYYVDNFKSFVPRHLALIQEPEKYTVHNNDTIIAEVRNYFDLNYVNSTEVYLAVLNEGPMGRHYVVKDTCATTGNQLEGFDLTNYNYHVGGALIADKIWYTSPTMDEKSLVPDPTNVTVSNGQTFYVDILDECGNTGSLSFEIYAIPEVNDGEISICEDVTLGSDQGVVDLTANSILSEINYTDKKTIIEWYTDAALTNRVSDATQVIVSDGDVLYANVYNKLACAVVVELKVNVTLVDDITFEDATFCADEGVQTLVATPKGGTFTSESPALTGNVFNPALADPTTKVVYEVKSDDGSCSNSKEVEITVNPEVTVTIDPVGKLEKGESTTLNANATPGANADYGFEWTPVESLVTATGPSVTTVELHKATEYQVIATDKTTGCDDTTKILVDVQSVVECNMDYESAVCAGTTVTVDPKRTGGFGPFTYDWTIPAGVTYTLTNDSLLVLNDLQAGEVSISVLITDLGSPTKATTICEANITVYSKPVLTLTAPTPTCEEDDLTITPEVTGGTEPFSHSWTQDVEILSSEVTEQVATVTTTGNAGNYFLTYTVIDKNGCQDEETVDVVIYKKPEVSVEETELSTCTDQAVRLKGIINTTTPYNKDGHLWTSTTGSEGNLSATNISNPIYESYIYGVHRFVYNYTDLNGCSASSEEVIVRMNEKPEFEIVVPDEDPCVGDVGVQVSAKNKTTTVDDEDLDYNWTINSMLSTDAKPLVPTDKDGKVDIILTVVDKNTGCESDEVKAAIMVNPNPIAEIITPSPIETCANEDITLKANSTQSDVAYTWSGTHISPKTGTITTFNAPSVKPSASYDIELYVENTITGCNATTTKEVTVLGLPEVSLGDDFEMCMGEDTVIVPNITFPTDDSYSATWTTDGKPMTSIGGNPTYTQKDNLSHKIAIAIEDKNGCFGYDEIEIQGLELPIVNAGPDDNAEYDIPYNLDGTATGGVEPYVWNWQPEDSISTSNKVPNPTIQIKETTEFTLSVTDSKGCKNSDDVTIRIIGKPLKVKIEQSSNLCYGETVTLTAIASGGDGTISYEWFYANDTLTAISTEQRIDVTLTETTEYMVRVKSHPLFDPARDFHTVIVNEKPTLTFNDGDNQDVCLFDTKLINPKISGGTPEYSFVWADGGPLTSTQPTYLFTNNAAAGTNKITLTVTDANGCVIDTVVTVNVRELPTVELISEMEVCINTPLVIEADAKDGQSPYAYSWTLSPNLETTGDKFATFTGKTDGPYEVEITVFDQYGCSGVDSKVIIVKAESDLSFPDNVAVCANQELELDINPDLETVNQFELDWVGGDKQYIKDSSDMFITTFLSPVPGDYKLEYVISENGCPRAGSIDITVHPEIKIAPIGPIEACVGVDFELTAQYTTGSPGAGGFEAWTGNYISPTVGGTTTFNKPTSLPETITFTAGNGKGCSDEIEIKVNVNPNPRVFINESPFKQVQYKQKYELVGNVIPPSGDYTYQWVEAANISVGSNSLTATTIPWILETPTDFELTVTDNATGCIGKESITISTERIIYEATRLTDDELDKPKDDQVYVDPDKVIDSNEIPVVPAALTVCDGDEVVIMPHLLSTNADTTGVTFYWENLTTGQIYNTINPTVKPGVPATVYRLTYKNLHGYVGTSDITILVVDNPVPNITISPAYGVDGDEYYFDGDLVIDGNPSGGKEPYIRHVWSTDNGTINDPAAQVTYWTPKAAQDPTTLTYLVQDSQGCVGIASKKFPLHEVVIPEILFDPLCEKNSYYFKLSKVYSPGTTYLWNINGTLYNVEQPFHYFPEAVENAEITVTVIPPVHEGPEVTITATTEVHAYANVEIGGPIHVCVGDTAKYTAVNTNNDRTLYSWDLASDIDPAIDNSYIMYWDGKDDELIYDVYSMPTNENAKVEWRKEGIGLDKIIVSAAVGNACFNEFELDVNIHPLPNVDFEYESVDKVYFEDEDKYRRTDSIFIDKQVDFTNLSFGARDTAVINSNIEFYWDFIGDGVYTENGLDATYQYDESGDFMVNLMAIEEIWGCKNVISKPLKVVTNPNCGLKFPNAFTPDLDDNNTFYPVYKQGIIEAGYELRIYNRWGSLLWSTNEVAQEWDGVYKGDVASQDVYVYHCKVTCEDIDPSTGENRILNIKGDVTLIR